ncbi:MAG: hypothetical protein ACREMA_00690 [Longimicrobiales bacterium]
MKVLIRCALCALLVSGCASAGGRRAPAVDRDRITAEQLARVPADNAYEAIRNLQPQWLEGRGPASVTDPTPATAVVYVDGNRVGDLETLRSFSLTSLSEIRYHPPGQASSRFGMGLPRGVIELISKGR